MPNPDEARHELWRGTMMEQILTREDAYRDLREKCLASCRELDHLLKEGNPEDRAFAQKTLNAYGHALSLLEEAVRARDKALDTEPAR